MPPLLGRAVHCWLQLTLRRKPMASIMLQYDRPTDHTRNWHDYNGRVRDWIARLLQTPGAVSFMAYRTADGSSPNTTTMLEFRTLEEAPARRQLRAPQGRSAGDPLNGGRPSQGACGGAFALHARAPPALRS